VAHLLTELEYIIQTEKTTCAIQFKELLQEAIKLKQALPAYQTDHAEILEIQKQLDALLKDTIPDSAENSKCEGQTQVVGAIQDRAATLLHNPVSY